MIKEKYWQKYKKEVLEGSNELIEILKGKRKEFSIYAKENKNDKKRI